MGRLCWQFVVKQAIFPRFLRLPFANFMATKHGQAKSGSVTTKTASQRVHHQLVTVLGQHRSKTGPKNTELIEEKLLVFVKARIHVQHLVKRKRPTTLKKALSIRWPSAHLMVTIQIMGHPSSKLSHNKRRIHVTIQLSHFSRGTTRLNQELSPNFRDVTLEKISLRSVQ